MTRWTLPWVEENRVGYAGIHRTVRTFWAVITMTLLLNTECKLCLSIPFALQVCHHRLRNFIILHSFLLVLSFILLHLYSITETPQHSDTTRFDMWETQVFPARDIIKDKLKCSNRNSWKRILIISRICTSHISALDCTEMKWIVNHQNPYRPNPNYKKTILIDVIKLDLLVHFHRRNNEGKGAGKKIDTM